MESAATLLPALPGCHAAQLFPRHVIEFLSTGGDLSQPANLGTLARSHADVAILFTDICGAEQRHSRHRHWNAFGLSGGCGWVCAFVK